MSDSRGMFTFFRIGLTTMLVIAMKAKKVRYDLTYAFMVQVLQKEKGGVLASENPP
jgi:hypothetical protein